MELEKCMVLMYGLPSENASNSAVNPLGGNCSCCDTAGDGSGSTQVLSFATNWVRWRNYDNHAPMKQPVLAISPAQLLV